MKKIGLIGGLSWQSTVDYYRYVNEVSNKQIGGTNTVECIIYSTNLKEKIDLVMKNDLDTLAKEFIEISKGLEAAGADCVLLCTNTMHIVYDEIEKNINVPMIHIGDATGEAIAKAGIKKVALLGTTFTCTHPFMRQRLLDQYGIETIVPDEKERVEIMRVIEEELTFDIIKETSREYFLKVIDRLSKLGAQGVILGCTEIQMLIKQEHTDLKVFDTTELHALKAVDFALGK